VHITCEHCGAEYDLDIPVAALSRGRGLRFRCSACGQRVLVQLDAPPEADAGEAAAPPVEAGEDPSGTPPPADDAPPDAPEAEPAPALSLRQGDKVFSVDDMATLQQWGVQRRVLAEDSVAFGGDLSASQSWVQASDVEDLAVFFVLVAQADRAAGLLVQMEEAAGRLEALEAEYAAVEATRAEVNQRSMGLDARVEEMHAKEDGLLKRTVELNALEMELDSRERAMQLENDAREATLTPPPRCSKLEPHMMLFLT